MLTIENINIINSKFAGTSEWQIGEMFLGSLSYVFVIHKRVGEWTIGDVKHSELTVRLHRIKAIDGYVMETGIVKQNYHVRSVHQLKDMKSILHFTMCLEKHIRQVIK